MKKTKKRLNESILDEIVSLDEATRRFRISDGEKNVLEAEQRFEATYYSNKFEGNKLSKDDARKAISISE